MPRSPAPDCECYSAAEVAAKLGLTVEHFYRRNVRAELVANGMPRSLTASPLRFPKRAFDAWLDRDHPLMPKAPGLAPAAPADPQSVREWSAFLDKHYR